MTSVCLGWASSRYSSFGGDTDCSSCWSCAHYPSVILAQAPENVRIHGLPGTIR